MHWLVPSRLAMVAVASLAFAGGAWRQFDKNVGYVLMANGRPSAALAVLDPAFIRNPNDPGLWRATARAQSLLGRFDDAIAIGDQDLRRIAGRPIAIRAV